MINSRMFIAEEKINPVLTDRKQRIYILSTSICAKYIFFNLLQHKVFVFGFVTNEKKAGKEKLYGLPIFSLDEIEEENSIYVISQDEWSSFQDSINEKKVYFLERHHSEKKEFLFKENGKLKKCNAALMITMILSRAKRKKVIFLVKSEYLEFWENLISVLKNDMCEVSIISVDKESEKIYDLLYSDLEKLLFFVAVFEDEEIVQILNELGFKETQNYVRIYNSFSGHTTDKYYGYDWYLGNTFVENKKFPGFYIHGDPINAKKKIVILGNSVTDPLFYPQKSWPEMLWEKCNKNSINITFFNGAITDYNSSNEVVKMLRDVLVLQPDIVISYSGFIDFRQYVPEYPYVNLNLMRTTRKWENDSCKEVIYGLADRRCAYDRWISNEKIMNQICQMQNIPFYGVLQPWIGSECENACEKLQVWSDNYWSVSFPQFDKLLSNAEEFKRRISYDVKQYDWLYDFTCIFSEIEDSDIFFDSIHVNEQGNQIISEKFGDLLGLFEGK